jgi:hypothetical protein
VVIATSTAAVHALIPLTVLEAMRLQDVPEPDGLDEYHVELATKRLGMSHTVERQIARYRDLAARDERVAREEVVALLRLAGRRPDADLLFADAGRRAGTVAGDRVSALMQGLHRGLPRVASGPIGQRIAGRLLRDVFGVELVRDGAGLAAEAEQPITCEARADGSACGFLGSAVAAVLRAYTGFEGAVIHERCRARGGERCRWQTTVPHGSGRS